MEVRWSLPAAEDLERICEWIERENPEAALRVARTIYDGCARLSDFPNLGPSSRRMAGRRELTFAPLSIRLSRTPLRFRAFSTARKTGLKAHILTFQKGPARVRKAGSNRPIAGPLPPDQGNYFVIDFFVRADLSTGILTGMPFSLISKLIETELVGAAFGSAVSRAEISIGINASAGTSTAAFAICHRPVVSALSGRLTRRVSANPKGANTKPRRTNALIADDGTSTERKGAHRAGVYFTGAGAAATPPARSVALYTFSNLLRWFQTVNDPFPSAVSLMYCPGPCSSTLAMNGSATL
jgi:plasmid stabilization system protein ParE